MLSRGVANIYIGTITTCTTCVAVRTFGALRTLYSDFLRFDFAIDNIGAQNGGTDFRIGTLYTRPATINANTDLSVGFELKQEDEPLYLIRQVGTVVSLRRVVSERFETEIGMAVFVSEVEDNFGNRDFTIYGVPMRAKYDARDNIVWGVLARRS